MFLLLHLVSQREPFTYCYPFLFPSVFYPANFSTVVSLLGFLLCPPILSRLHYATLFQLALFVTFSHTLYHLWLTTTLLVCSLLYCPFNFLTSFMWYVPSPAFNTGLLVVLEHPGGGSVIRLSLDRRSVNLLPIAQ